ncbi:MAG: ankyrin repeat domain-containing protein, partial [Rhodospirillales bacterium]|nr:ankyrin repeat domain-containing protein [Rhodospirillales bacterium]
MIASLVAASPAAGQSTRNLQNMLFNAVRANDADAVRSILQAGADATKPDLRGRTAIDMAVAGGYFDIARQLILARRLRHDRAAVITIAQDKAAAKPPVRSAAVLKKPRPVVIIEQTVPEAVPKIIEKGILTKPQEPKADPAKSQPAPKQHGELANPMTEAKLTRPAAPAPAPAPEAATYDKLLAAAARLTKAAAAMAAAENKPNDKTPKVQRQFKIIGPD